MTTPEIVIARDAEHSAHTLLIVREGRKLLHALALHNPPVRLVKLPREDRRYMRPLELRGRPYPLARALRLYRQAGRTLGITKGAATMLRALDQARKGSDE